MKQILILILIFVIYQTCMSQEMNEFLLLNKVTYLFDDYSTNKLVWRDVISPDSQSVSIVGIGPIDWSWNDTYILCVASLNNQGNIYITNVTSLASFPIPNISKAFEFDLARNESSLLYSKRLNIPPYSQIWKINIDGSGNQLLAEGRESKWSPDGTYIIYTTDVTERNNQIRTMNADGSNNMVLVQATPGDSIVFTKPLFSPDGSKIAFVESPNPNGPPDTAYVVVADANGTNQTRIYTLPKGDRAPAAINWSPTGDKLSIWEGEPVVEWNLWVVNSNGTNPLMVVQNANDWEYSFSSWAPDGNRIVFTAQSSIDIINDDGTNRQTVATLAGGQRYTHVSWSKNSGVSTIFGIKNSPKSFYLYPNYPNPFNPLTKIKFVIPSSESIAIKVYDILGKEVNTILNEFKYAGTYEVDFDASNLPSGIYFYRMISGSYTETKKMILLR